MSYYSFLTKIILRILLLKVKYVFKSRKSNLKALLCYTIVPPPTLQLNFFYKKLHNRYLVSKIMIEVLNDLGYDVYLYDYLNENIDYTVDYDLFIGHNKYFSKIAAKLSRNCKRVLLTTGCSPEYDNAQLERRNTYLKNLKNIKSNFYIPASDTNYAKINCEVADHIFMIGSTYIRDNGWYPIVRQKAFLYNNISLFDPELKNTDTTTFLYMSSIGQLRRGLDLILGVFSKRNEKIFICGPFNEEPLFAEHFNKELYHTDNIIPIGYVIQNSDAFRKIIQQVDFAILPSCSEGQSGSLLTLMNFGLIPIATDNVGFEGIDDFGIKVADFNIESVNEAIEKAVNLSLDEKIKKRKGMFKILKEKYTASAFKETFAKFIRNIV